MQPYHREELWFPCSLDILAWDEHFHALMLGDRLRMTAYEAAIKCAVRPGDIVVDLGTGTGILAHWACEAGARRVYGIECSHSVLEMAKQRLAQAGYENRFIGIHALSYAVELPEKADLIISEIIGNIGDNEDCTAILADARRRMLAPGGRMLPQNIATYFVPVSAPAVHGQILSGVCQSVSETQDVRKLLDTLGLASPFDVYYDVILPRSTYLAEARPGLCFDFCQGVNPTAYAITLRFTAKTSGSVTGFKGFFVAQLADTVILDIEGEDHGDGQYSDSWKHCYLPLEHPLDVQTGDIVVFTLVRREADRSTSPFSCRYTWRATVAPPDDSNTFASTPKRQEQHLGIAAG
ncbi:methyltransferase domain-containing protein [Paraburkholderia aspalathi]|uniref:Protein arginine N-methyltransferase 1 n=1 Tax=Paraburkholderia aspalathi TaxID=1324617 RepID=A0A1I7ACY1_9BURK|nr:class I SAM-dependent methyltransferase [Paraburkholderia aspalathi]SFT72723.1 protein arginine N-methyltransferase 1 [Paraburkholderia aspalathi]